MWLLWVENHTAFARLAGRQFLSTHELIVVPSVAAAKGALSERAFDAVLVDYDLDDGKGVTVVEFARQLDTHLVMIATSPYADGNAALLAAGTDAACPKMRFAEIESVLASVVRC